jgi:hypothetical protein
VKTPASTAVGALLLLSTSLARAAEAPPATVRLEVNALADCASSADVAKRVNARSPRIRFVDDVNTEVTVRMEFRASSGRVATDIAFSTAAAKAWSRHLVAASCAQAAEAAALIISITLDPASGDRSRPEDVSETSSTSSGATAGANKEGSPEASSNATPSESGDKGSPVASVSEVETVRATDSWRRTPTRLRYGIHFGGQVLGGAAPGVMPGLAMDAFIGLDGSTLWSPALGLGASHSWRSELPEQGGSASFMLDVLSLDACILRFQLSTLEARACGSALLGRLSAEGSKTLNPSGTVRRPFAAAGAAGIVTLRLAPIFEASARIAAGLTLVRDSFEFGASVFHTVPPLAFSATVGLGLRSP